MNIYHPSPPCDTCANSMLDAMKHYPASDKDKHVCQFLARLQAFFFSTHPSTMQRPLEGYLLNCRINIYVK